MRAVAKYGSLLVLFLPLGCATGNPRSDTSVTERLRQGRLRHEPEPASTSSPAPAKAAPIAMVNGVPIERDRFETLLQQSHGLFVLDQLIALEVIRQQAQREGVSVSRADIQAEYDRSIMEMARPMADDSDEKQLRRLGKQLLAGFLRDKNISPEEYWLSMERNALLRKMVRDEVTVTADEVQVEVARRFGPKVVVRHIVLADMQAVDQVLQRLRQGESFSDLAQTFSTNRSSAAAGGLLPEISSQDPDVPQIIRDVVFDLPVGKVSDAVRIDGQYHLFKVESRSAGQMPPAGDPLRRRCREALLDRRMREAMQSLERKLVKSAEIRIQDPQLEKQDVRRQRTR